MSFNTSTRKEDVSLKLRQKNLRNTKESTRQLELESRQMEERLQQLKTAMTMQKEQRSDGQEGFWKSGQTGTLGSYSKEVLNKPNKPKGQKQRKIKILKEEPPTAPPERHKGPGTMAHLARGGLAPGGGAGKENKKAGPRCGQCEEKSAQVTCIECGEDYCAQCFAGFHLRGNLRKHRSVPVGSGGALTPRGMVTPRNANKISPDTVATRQMEPLSQAGVTKTSPSSGGDSDHTSGTLMSGDYDESESAQSFQDALKAWRNPGTAATTATAAASVTTATSKKTSEHREPVASTDSGTSMETSSPSNVDIRFTPSLSYAERLLLKKHRRSDVQELPDDFTSLGSRSSASDYHGDVMATKSAPALSEDQSEETPVEVLAELRATNEDGIKWRDMHRTRREDTIAGPDYYRSESRVSIIELEDEETTLGAGRRRRQQEGASYEVTEAGVDEDRRILQERRDSARTERKTAFASPRKPPKHETKAEKPPPKPPTNHTTRSATPKSSRKPANKTPSNDTDLSIDLSKVKGEGQSKSSARVKSARLKSARSRPQSRAMSRAETARALFGEGELTKAPSNALREVARMTPRHDPTPFLPTMTDFFTAGVVTPQQDKVMTPSKFKVKQDEAGIAKWKVSNQLYHMAPRAWDPTSSLQTTVSADDAQLTIADVTAGDLHRVTSGAALVDDTEQTVSFSIADGVRVSESGSDDLHTSDLAAMRITTPHDPRPTSQASLRPLSARSQSAASDKTLTPRPESRAIVVDGDDLSCYDDDTDPGTARQDDEDALYNLEYELAREDGRVDSDGKMSRLSLQPPGDSPDDHIDDPMPSPAHAATMRILGDDTRRPPSPGASYDARVNDLMDDFEEMERELMDEDEVRALH